MKRAALLRIVCLLVMCPALLLATGCGVEGEDIEFPYLLKVAAGNALIVHGHVFQSDVWCRWGPDDTLRIEGLAVLPGPAYPRPEPSEALLCSLYNKVPFVQGLIAAGHTWREAAEAYNGRRAAFEESLKVAYWRTLSATGSQDSAVQAMKDAMDWELVDPSVEPKYTPGKVGFVWRGLKYFIVEFPKTPPDETRGSRVRKVPTEDDARKFVMRIAERMGGRVGGPWVDVIHRGQATFGGKAALKALRQIDQAREGNLVEGPLKERDLRQILEVEGQEE